MSRSSSSISSSKDRQALRFVSRLAAIGLALLAVDRFVVGSTPFMRFLYENRPQGGTVDYHTWVEKQMMAVDYLGRSPEPKLVFVGSSSVTNGIDAARIQPALSRIQPSWRAINFGMNSLCAYELPMLKGVLLRPGVRSLVFLYNTFSFTDDLVVNAPRTHWDSAEFVSLAGAARTFEYRRDVRDGLLGELFVTIRYRELIRDTLRRAIADRLGPPANDYDFPIDEPVPPLQSRVPEAPLPESDPGRRMRTAGAAEGESLSYRGFRRFLEIARERGVRVVVMPAPEAEYGTISSYLNGVDISRIDAHVARITSAEGALLIPRRAVRHLEVDDHLFRDPVHLHWRGREIFSDLLAEKYIGVMTGAEAH